MERYVVVAMTREVLSTLLQEAFPKAEIHLTDLAGDDDHWSVTIVDTSFIGLSRVAQHRLVHDALQGKLGGQLHALQIKTKAKEV